MDYGRCLMLMQNKAMHGLWQMSANTEKDNAYTMADVFDASAE